LARSHSLLDSGNLFIYQQRERAVFACLRRAGVSHAQLNQLRILEVGCGGGGLLPLLVYYGASPQLLYGIDRDADRIRAASQRHRGLKFGVADATDLPLYSAAWDIVAQSTLFTSILQPAARAAAAREMSRVLKPGGFILWFDFRYNNPQNPHVRGVTRIEIERVLFPGARTFFLRTVLLPPLARRLVPVSRLLAEGLSLIPPLLTHYCALIWPVRDNRSPR